MSIYAANGFLTVALVALLAGLWYLHESDSKRQDELIRTLYGFLFQLQQSLGQDRWARADASRRLQDLLGGRDPAAGASDCLVEPLTPAEVAERICGVLTKQPPQLERVISFSMWMTREYMQEVVGLRDEELEEVRDQVAPARFWPAPGITIEEWSTHTVVSCQSRHFSLYEPLWCLCRASWLADAPPWKPFPVTLRSHTFEGRRQFVGEPRGVLEVVLHQNVIKCWGHGGRFQGGELSVKPENVFITIPLLDELHMKQYLAPSEEGPFVQAYRHADARGYGWDLFIKDLLSWSDSERPSRLYWRKDAAERQASCASGS